MPYYQRLQTPIIGQIFMLYFLTFTLPQGAHVLHLFLYISGVIGDKLRIYIYSRKTLKICTAAHQHQERKQNRYKSDGFGFGRLHLNFAARSRSTSTITTPAIIDTPCPKGSHITEQITAPMSDALA